MNTEQRRIRIVIIESAIANGHSSIDRFGDYLSHCSCQLTVETRRLDFSLQYNSIES